MLAEIAIVGSVVGAVVVGISAGLAGRGRRPADPWTAEAAIRAALRGPEAAAVRAEFCRRGITPPPRRRVIPIP